MTTIYRHELRTRILEKALALFKKHGVRSVKMDDVAAALTISKRTLYELYDNKEALLFECVKYGGEQRDARMARFAARGHSEMEIVVEALNENIRELGQVNPLFFAEVRRYGHIVDYLQQMHEQRHEQIISFFRQCIQKGYFRPDINVELVIRMGDGVVDYVMNNRMYERFTLQEIFRSYVSVFLRGICTEKGLAQISKIL